MGPRVATQSMTPREAKRVSIVPWASEKTMVSWTEKNFARIRLSGRACATALVKAITPHIEKSKLMMLTNWKYVPGLDVLIWKNIKGIVEILITQLNFLQAYHL